MSTKFDTDKTADSGSRKTYVKPRLEHLGSLREVTATGSGRSNEPSSSPGGGTNPDATKRRP